MIQGCAGSWEAMMLHMMALSITEVEYMTLTEAVKEVIWLNGFSTESEFKPRLVVGIATGALTMAIPGSRASFKGIPFFLIAADHLDLPTLDSRMEAHAFHDIKGMRLSFSRD
ncbi:hypothetical protein Tco_0084408 [Tanacetum coccineum]